MAKKEFDKEKIIQIENELFLNQGKNLSDEDKLYYRDYKNNLYENDVEEMSQGMSNPAEKLREKYKGKLSRKEAIFINCLVLNNCSQEQAFLYAYPKMIEHTRLYRNYKMTQVLNREDVKNYRADLENYIFEESKNNYKWNKELALSKLLSLLGKAEEDLKPKVDEYGNYETPELSKNTSDTILGVIKALNDLEGLNAPTKLQHEIAPVTFIDGNDFEDFPDDEDPKGE